MSGLTLPLDLLAKDVDFLVPGEAGGGGGGGGGNYSAVVLEDSPFVYWRLGESSGTEAADESGNGNTGTYNNTPNLGQPGAISGDADTAVEFRSANSEYLIADSVVGDWSTFAGTSEARTIEFWIKTTEGDNANVMGTVDDGSENFVTIDLNREADGTQTAGHTAYRCRDEGNDIQAESWDQQEVDIYDGEWHHIAIVQDSDTSWRIYVDATQVSTTQYTAGGTYGPTAGWDYPMAVGARNLRGVIDRHADVLLDEIAFYHSALSESRVQAHYDEGIGA